MQPHQLEALADWLVWAVITVVIVIGLCIATVLLWELPRLIRNLVTWVSWRRFWRQHSQYVPEYWEEQVRR